MFFFSYSLKVHNCALCQKNIIYKLSHHTGPKPMSKQRSAKSAHPFLEKLTRCSKTMKTPHQNLF